MKYLLTFFLLVSLIGFGKIQQNYFNARLDNQLNELERQLERQIVLEMNELRFGAADITKLVAGMNYTLSGSGVSSSATSLTLISLTLPQNGYKIQDNDLSSTFYITLEPGNRTRQEIVSCTTVVQNAAGTASLSGCTRGLSPITPYTASSSLQFAHAGGTSVIFSDPPQVFTEFLALGNMATSTNTFVFSSTTPPHYDWNPNFSNFPTTTLVSKTYVDSVAVAGASNADESTKGIVELATGAESASSTITGGTGARLVTSNTYSTSSPYTSGSWSVWTMPNAKIKQLFLDLTEAFTWTGLHIFNATTTQATTTINHLGVSTTTPSGLAVGAFDGDVYITGGLGIGQATTSNNNLLVTGLASTTNLTVSGVCTNCATNGWEQVSAGTAGPTTGGSSGTITVDCSAGRTIVGGGGTVNVAQIYITDSYAPDSNTWSVTFEVGSAGVGANTITAHAICVR